MKKNSKIQKFRAQEKLICEKKNIYITDLLFSIVAKFSSPIAAMIFFCNTRLKIFCSSGVTTLSSTRIIVEVDEKTIDNNKILPRTKKYFGNIFFKFFKMSLLDIISSFVLLVEKV